MPTDFSNVQTVDDLLPASAVQTIDTSSLPALEAGSEYYVHKCAASGYDSPLYSGNASTGVGCVCCKTMGWNQNGCYFVLSNACGSGCGLLHDTDNHETNNQSLAQTVVEQDECGFLMPTDFSNVQTVDDLLPASAVQTIDTSSLPVLEAGSEYYVHKCAASGYDSPLYSGNSSTGVGCVCCKTMGWNQNGCYFVLSNACGSGCGLLHDNQSQSLALGWNVSSMQSMVLV